MIKMSIGLVYDVINLIRIGKRFATVLKFEFHVNCSPMGLRVLYLYTYGEVLYFQYRISVQ